MKPVTWLLSLSWKIIAPPRSELSLSLLRTIAAPVVIDAEASLLDRSNFDLVSENTNLDENISDEVTLGDPAMGVKG